MHDNCDGKLWKRYEGYFKKDIKLEDSKNYIFFLYERLKSARIICMIIKDQNILLVQLEKEFLLEKKRILKNFFYPYRKLILIKWFWEERFETTFKDFIFI